MQWLLKLIIELRLIYIQYFSVTLEYINYIKQHWIEITALIIAAVSALFSLYSSIIANRAYRLAFREFESKKSKFSLSTIDSFRALVKSKQETRKLLLFNITLKNLSSTKNSFKANVEIVYIRKDDSVGKVVLNHDPDLSALISNKKFNILPLDIKVNENDTITGWLIFKQPSLITDEFVIEKYILELTDSHNTKENNEILLLRDTIHNYEDQSK